MAEEVVDSVVGKLTGTYASCRTAATPLPGGHVRDAALTIAEARRDYDNLVPSDTIPHLVAAYGSAYREVADLARTHAEWSARLATDSPVVGAELVWAVRHEMALTLCDAVLRRTPLGALGYPGDAAVAQAAFLVATRWSESVSVRNRGSARRLGVSKTRSGASVSVPNGAPGLPRLRGPSGRWVGLD